MNPCHHHKPLLRSLPMACLLLMVGCQMQPSKNPLIAEAKTLLVSSNVPVNQAWAVDASSNQCQRKAVSGVDVVGAFEKAVAGRLEVKRLPAAVIEGQLNARTSLQKLGTPRILPRTDADLVLRIHERGIDTSSGYFNAAVPAYVPGATSVGGLTVMTGRTVMNIHGGQASCFLNCTLFDGKSGEMLAAQTFTLNKSSLKGESPEETLRRLIPQLAEDMAIVLGFKAGKASTIYVRDERQTKAQRKEEWANSTTHSPTMQALEDVQDRIWQSTKKDWAKLKERWQRKPTTRPSEASP